MITKGKLLTITSWLVSAYDFYSQVVEYHKQTSEISQENLYVDIGDKRVKVNYT